MQHLAGEQNFISCWRSVGRLALLEPLRNDNFTAWLAGKMGASDSSFAIGDRRGPLWVVCHERAVRVQRRRTVREMKEGPSRPAVRCRSQATASCCRQERWW